MQIRHPPRRFGPDGHERRVGFELEFSGLSPRRTAEVAARVFGGIVERDSELAYRTSGAQWGDFRSEVDARRLQWLADEGYLGEEGEEVDIWKWVGSAVKAVSGQVIPVELIMPPVPISRIAELEKVREALREEGAEGTEDSPLYGFGLHINAEAASLRASYLCGVLKAFLLLFESLLRKLDVDWTRRVLPFIEPFPESYVRLVVDPAYRPSRKTFIADYLRHNPTRYRALDLLPILAHLDEERVGRWLGDEGLVKARPAFHYRLPNSSVQDPSWSMIREWNRWVEVEELAEEKAKLDEMGGDYLESTETFLRQWKELISQWLQSDLSSE